MKDRTHEKILQAFYKEHGYDKDGLRPADKQVMTDKIIIDVKTIRDVMDKMQGSDLKDAYVLLETALKTCPLIKLDAINLPPNT